MLVPLPLRTPEREGRGVVVGLSGGIDSSVIAAPAAHPERRT